VNISSNPCTGALSVRSFASLRSILILNSYLCLQDQTRTCGHPGQANNLTPLKTDIFQIFVQHFNSSTYFHVITTMSSAPYKLAPQAAARLVHPLVQPCMLMSLHFSIYDQKCVCISHFSHECYILHQSHTQ
jgi:hypothetical protein